LRALDVAGVAKPILDIFQEKLYDQINSTVVTQKQVNWANNLASKFKVDLQQPDLSPAPPGFYKNPAWLDPEKILNIISFWDGPKSGIKFKSLWTKICRYGQGKHLTEDEHRFILGTVLEGDPLDDLTRMERANDPLHSIVKKLALLYNEVDTLDEHKF
jgi:hypothetical protein